MNTIETLLRDPARAADVPLEDVAALTCAIRAEQARLRAEEVRLEALVDALLARLVGGCATSAPLVSVKEVARQLGVGVDWVRDHGEDLGLTVRLSEGTVRGVPERVEAFKKAPRGTSCQKPRWLATFSAEGDAEGR